MDELLIRVRAILATTPARWINLAETLPLSVLAQSPAPGQWSAIECLQHLVDTEGLFQTRLASFLAGQDFPAFDPDREGTRPNGTVSMTSLAHELARLRSQSLEALAGIAEDDLARAVRHAALGPVTLREMINEWAAHDLNHTVQGERALMQSFIGGSGPWAPYFADHVALTS